MKIIRLDSPGDVDVLQYVDHVAGPRFTDNLELFAPLSQARRAQELLERAQTLGKVALRPD
jgi:hypothetical protein